jgi:hypothetical protein
MLSDAEKSYLRELAKKQRELAALPEMKEKTELWYANNECRSQRPVFTIEIETFWEEVRPEYFCTSPEGRMMEGQMLMNITAHDILGDDRVIPDFFAFGPRHSFKAFGLDIKRNHGVMENGKKSIGFKNEIVIEDLERDFHKLKKSIIIAEKPEKNDLYKLCEDTLGDILPLRFSYGCFGLSLSRVFVDLMGMEKMLLALYDAPEKFHEAMKMQVKDIHEYMNLLEEKEVLTLNNGNSWLGQGTRGFTHELPTRDLSGGSTIVFSDLWGYMDSQETVGISPEMFEEFFFPYYKEITDRFGMLSYGCCEPVHVIWDNCLSKLKNLKKVSISPWCDQAFMGERLRGKKIIFHRKPRPDYLGVHNTFDEDGFRAHVLETVNAARGCALEFSYRDVYSLRGERERGKRAYQTALDVFEKHWGK